MFNSTIVDVVAGLLFAFLAISLAASSINEAIASLLNSRGTALLAGIQKFLNDPTEDGLVLQIYNHALTHPQGNGAASTVSTVQRPLPAYMEPAKFAAALVDSVLALHGPASASNAVLTGIVVTDAVAAVVVTTGGDGASPPPPPIKDAIAQIPNPQLRRTLERLYARADGEITRFEVAVADWFDGAMDRVSGLYKRYSQLWVFLIALAIVVLLNIDAIHIAKVLWQQPWLAKGITAASMGNAAAALAQFDQLGLPLGWTGWPIGQYFGESLPLLGWLSAIVGWLITALATLFGAPFWFDLLQRVTRLRGSGPAPGGQP
jgi:hypothetical protein